MLGVDCLFFWFRAPPLQWVGPSVLREERVRFDAVSGPRTKGDTCDPTRGEGGGGEGRTRRAGTPCDVREVPPSHPVTNTRTRDPDPEDPDLGPDGPVRRSVEFGGSQRSFIPTTVVGDLLTALLNYGPSSSVHE